MWDTYTPTDIVGTSAENKCSACTTFSTTTRNFLSNKLVEFAITDGLIFICKDILPSFGVKNTNCEGLIKQQWEDGIYPLLVDEMLTDQTFCDFLIPVCETDKFHRI